MTDTAPPRRRHPVRGYLRAPARLAVPVVAGLALAGCGPSPVDMVEHPVTSTPSRMAGERLQRAAVPEESCAPAPVAPEVDGAGDRTVDSAGPGPDRVGVPRSPERILALGAGAVDVACALGLQDLVVGTSGLPRDADAYLPRPLVELPTLDPASEDAAGDARELRPDLIVLADPGDLDPAVVDALGDVAPTVVYDADVLNWADATEAVADAYGRPRAGGELLLDVITLAEATAERTTPSDTRVSLLSVEGDEATVQRPDTLGSLMLEAVGAQRPPGQRTRDGEGLPPLPESPLAGDELDGDVIFVVVGGDPGAEERARAAFADDRFQDLGAVGARRIFVVDRAVWEGAGPVAARSVLGDIGGSINGLAPDG